MSDEMALGPALRPEVLWTHDKKSPQATKTLALSGKMNKVMTVCTSVARRANGLAGAKETVRMAAIVSGPNRAKSLEFRGNERETTLRRYVQLH